jgi:hypothetical protein
MIELSLSSLHCRGLKTVHLLDNLLDISLGLHSRYLSAATWLSVYSLGPDPIGNIALALFSGQPFPSNAFVLSCLSGRYQVTSTSQAYNFYVLFYDTLYFGRL